MKKKIFFSFIFILLPKAFAETITTDNLGVQPSQIGSGIGLVPTQIGTIMLAVFFISAYFLHRHIKKNKKN